jgi:acyl-CoA hydrolase
MAPAKCSWKAFLELFHAGVLRRRSRRASACGVFVLSRAFYRALREMPPATEKFRMSAVSYVNELYGDKPPNGAPASRLLVNGAMMATLLGAIVSDGLEKPGGQRGGGDNTISSRVSPCRREVHRHGAGRAPPMVAPPRTFAGNTGTPPSRHLRDIVVTEYGVADLRG